MNVFQKQNCRQRSIKTLKYCILIMVLFVMVAVVVHAATPSLEQQLMKEKNMATDHQNYLTNRADGIRYEISQLQPMVDKLNKELTETKEDWKKEEGKIESINQTLQGLERELNSRL